MFSLVETSSIFVLAAICLALGLLKALSKGFDSDLSKIPGPWLARFTNLPLKAAAISGRKMHYVHSLFEQYGPYVRIAPDEVAVNDAAGFAEIHRFGSHFVKTPWYREMTNQVENPGIFSIESPSAHATRRKCYGRTFSKTFLASHWHDDVRNMARRTVGRIHQHAVAGTVDVLKWWTFMSMDVSGRLFYGHDFGNIEQGEPSELYKILTTQLMVNGISQELPWIKAAGWLLKYIPMGTLRNPFRDHNALQEQAGQLVENLKDGNSGTKNIFTDIAAAAEKGEKLSLKDVPVESVGLLIASTDTTAITLAFLIWAVLSRPELRRKLEEEVATLSDDFTEADVEKLPLLNAVIEETLRLYGAAPANLPRLVPEGGATLGGYYLPQRTTVHTQAHSFHRDANFFPNPEEFRPSRWINDEVSLAAKKVFHPFGAGARICMGMQLAYMELRLATAEFFRKCKGARLAASVTAESMELEDYFLVNPKAHRMEITMS